MKGLTQLIIIFIILGIVVLGMRKLPEKLSNPELSDYITDCANEFDIEYKAECHNILGAKTCKLVTTSGHRPDIIDYCYERMTEGARGINE